jgi:hypothetical protein
MCVCAQRCVDFRHLRGGSGADDEKWEWRTRGERGERGEGAAPATRGERGELGCGLFASSACSRPLPLPSTFVARHFSGGLCNPTREYTHPRTRTDIQREGEGGGGGGGMRSKTDGDGGGDGWR